MDNDSQTEYNQFCDNLLKKMYSSLGIPKALTGDYPKKYSMSAEWKANYNKQLKAFLESIFE